MGLFKSLAGMLILELTSADISMSIAAINGMGIPVFDVTICDDLSARLKIYRRDFRKISALAERRGEKLRIVGRSGVYWAGKRLLHRPVLTAGMLLLLCLAAAVPTRVLFVTVEGNETVPTNLILAAAEESGIAFGASRREVRSEQVKNALLSAVPQLQWAGVNTRGCVAVISVRERADNQKSEDSEQVASIVADRDGVILSVTVTRGNGLCAVGQAVQAGDILISGYTDCGLCVTATRAEGEVMAQTRRFLKVKTPAEIQIRGTQGRQDIKYSLIVGKKRINFYKSSGISDSSCVKMYTEYCLNLPGGFQLPVTLVKETVTAYDADIRPVAETEAESRLTKFAGSYLRQQMVAGSMTDRSERITPEGGTWCMTGEYACIEMIGRVQTEQIGEIP